MQSILGNITVFAMLELLRSRKLCLVELSIVPYSLPIRTKGGKCRCKFDSNLSGLHPYHCWMGPTSITCTGGIWWETLNAHRSISRKPLAKHIFLNTWGSSFHSLEFLKSLDFLSASRSNTLGRYLAVIVILWSKK